MEQSLFYSCLFIVIVATLADDSCITWPSNMKSIKTCCHLPTSVASFEEQVCLRKCLQPEKESEDVRSCIEDCFIATSPLLTKDKEINKGVALYSSSIFPSGFDSLWETKINASLDKCDFNASGNLSFGLAQYFHCVRENLIQNCVLFKRHVKGCSLTEEHFKKCKNIELNCSEPIEHFAVEHCCIEPVLIREQLSRDCEYMCRKAEFFGPLVKRCFLECITNETNLVSEDGNLHIEAAKALLFANSNKNDEWEKPIAGAVEACGKDLEGSYNDFNVH